MDQQGGVAARLERPGGAKGDPLEVGGEQRIERWGLGQGLSKRANVGHLRHSGRETRRL